MPEAKVIWFEIYVADLERARTFYGRLFGWKFEALTEYDPEYWTIRAGKDSIGALVRRPSAQSDNRVPPLGSVVYVEVESVDQMLSRAVELGGTVERKRTLISSTAGAFGLIRDPDGNTIGLWMPLPSLQ